MLINPKTFIDSDAITLVHSGEDYFSKLDSIIRKSQSDIHIQMYIFDNDETGKKVVTALKEAASRNVKIYLLLDSFGSNSLTNEFIADLAKSGIEVRFFSTFFSANSFYISRRMHHKIVVADNKTMLIGGINIADKYSGIKGEIPWLDYAIQINGRMAKPVQALCKNIYDKTRTIETSKISYVFHLPKEISISILRNDWLYGKSEINNAYLKSIRNAKNEIVIVGSYFLPGRRLTYALKKASKNNVRIKLILSGVSDIPLLKSATHFFYKTLLQNNIELYEWEKSVLHGKAAVIDGRWTTIGSFNLNNLSSYGSIEMNVGINSAAFSLEFLEHLNGIIAQCKPITKETIKMKPYDISIYTNQFSYWFIRIILLIITYLPYKRFLKNVK